MALDANLLNTQHYNVRIKGKVGQSRDVECSALHFGAVAIKKGALGSPSTKVANFTLSLTSLQNTSYSKEQNIIYS